MRVLTEMLRMVVIAHCIMALLLERETGMIAMPLQLCINVFGIQWE